ncbi:MAG: SIS domain protein [uncultured Nocardioidaceae bacterium]|uniref:Glutamine--fructose-6-phosphate aminotransferase [isomerizing] n=1 Tax=uncultured Nocardioidaceae bacterium TaxID=253824 RepID=A0A6J4LBA5_9ACTN|nr:MAG: SIS domain protein [uncultured Nocardioidaceae bacterium]
MNPSGFLADLYRKPAALTSLAALLRQGDPWSVLEERPARVVLLGMGSSMYAAAVAAARLRARGVVAVAELASSDLLPDWGPGTLAVAISASGASKETLDSVDRLRGRPRTVALTNTPASALTRRCDEVVLMGAGPEDGGVACRSYQHTLALLLALEAHLSHEPLDGLVSTLERTAEASAHLLRTSGEWLEAVTELLDGPAGTHIAAPARRLSSAQQSALMLREGPRRSAVACEAGDWAHVDVYLTKNTDYRLLVLPGSPWDRGIVEWTGPRDTTVVSVGGAFPDARYTVRYPYDDDDDVRLLAEVLVAELVAARLWATT